MNNTYVHIGLHKTGTTYLQNNIFPYIESVYFQRGWNSYRHLMKKKINDKLLISDESLSGNVFGGNYRDSFFHNMEVIKTTFNNPKIIIGFRKHSSLIFSLYKQYLHQGNYLPIEEFFNLENTGLLKEEDFYFKEKLDYLKTNFEDVFVYDQSMLKNNEEAILHSMLLFLDVKAPLNLDRTKKNSNEGIKTIAQFKVLKYLNKFNKNKRTPNLYSRKFKRFKVTPRDIAQNYMRNIKSEPFLLKQEFKKKIDTHYQNDWEYILQFVLP